MDSFRSRMRLAIVGYTAGYARLFFVFCIALVGYIADRSWE